MLRQEAAEPKELYKRLHPRLRRWFRKSYPTFTHSQLLAVPAILERESILLTSPTGSGKTLAGFLGVFDFLLRKLDAGALRPAVQCIYVSPLRALAYDIGKNISAPIAGMELEKEFLVHSRTGDTKASGRARFRRRASHILVTTPESLAVMLAQESYAQHLGECQFVIVDELHSFAGNKRGADLTLSLERLERLRSMAEPGTPPLCRIGLSATAAPLDALARFLVGEERQCRIAEARIEKRQIVEVFSPIRRKPYPPAGYTGVRLYAELAELIRSRRSVLVFTNVRSAAEQLGLKLRELLPELVDQIETHHASLDRSVRLEVEDRLKDGELRAVVCSTSLEMGIDIGAVDLVVMVATPKGVSRAIQRIGRSGHSLNRNSHGILVATNINDLAEATVTAKRVRERQLEPIRVQRQPVDVVAQHIVGLAAVAPIAADEVFALLRRASPFAELTREEFDRIVQYLEGGGVSLQKQYAGLFGKIRVDDGVISLAHLRVAREFLVNIGTIVSESFVDVFLRRRRLGSVEENFIKQLQIGDLFVLGGRIVRLIETGVQAAYVERADGHLPTVPRWNAAKMPLTSGLAEGVRNLRAEIAERLAAEEHGAEASGARASGLCGQQASRLLVQKRQARRPSAAQPGRPCSVVDWLVESYEISIANAEAILEQFRAQLSVSELPVGEKMLIELYREGEHSHYFFHSLIGRSANDALSRIVAWRVKNRIGGNALVTIDDYGFLLTLRPFQELPLADWRLCFEREGAEEDLYAALRGSELVKWQFRGVAQTGLMVPRHLPGRERKPKQLTWSSEVLFRVLEQHEPDHPLLNEAYRQAMHIFLDAEEACAFLDRVQQFRWSLRELPVVSPFSFAIYASKIKESMMLEDPGAAIERIYADMYARVEAVTNAH
ncbi:MAG: DEAD/DEAH box helicase [Verrucomicrobiota bacterium]|nr:DEAD/DEAH box helicase [Verrucomicrobiota bacterium]